MQIARMEIETEFGIETISIALEHTHSRDILSVGQSNDTTFAFRR